MQRPGWKRRVGWLAGVALAVAAAAAAGADGPREPDSHLDLIGPGEVKVQGEPIRLSDHWIGVECYPVRDATLRAQLDLPEDQGLSVLQVVAEGPAAKAGIQPHDILLEADDKPLRGIQDLIDAVDAVKDKELTIELLRGGKSKQVKVKPAKRPEAPPPPLLPKRPGGPDLDLKKWLDELGRLRPWGPDKQPGRFRLWGPGTILPPDAKIHPPMPGNMSVNITKNGDEPAKIVVKQDGQKWEVTEDELDKLPSEVRPHVERMLGRMAFGRGKATRSFDFHWAPEWKPEWDVWPEGRMDKRLEEMNRRIDELRKSIEELRAKRPRLKPVQPKAKEAPAPRLKKAPEKKRQERV